MNTQEKVAERNKPRKKKKKERRWGDGGLSRGVEGCLLGEDPSASSVSRLQRSEVAGGRAKHCDVGASAKCREERVLLSKAVIDTARCTGAQTGRRKNTDVREAKRVKGRDIRE